MSRDSFQSLTAATAVLASTCALGAVELTIDVPELVRYGTRTKFLVKSLDNAPCGTRRVVSVKLDGQVVTAPQLSGGAANLCGNAQTREISIPELAFGTHTVETEFRYGDELVATKQARFTVIPQFEGPLPGGGSLKLALADPGNAQTAGTCEMTARTGTYDALADGLPITRIPF